MHSMKRRLTAMALAMLGGVALLAAPARADEFRLHSSDIVNQIIKRDQVQSSNYGAGCAGATSRRIWIGKTRRKTRRASC
jgi:hypothetical protein